MLPKPVPVHSDWEALMVPSSLGVERFYYNDEREVCGVLWFLIEGEYNPLADPWGARTVATVQEYEDELKVCWIAQDGEFVDVDTALDGFITCKG